MVSSMFPTPLWKANIGRKIYKNEWTQINRELKHIIPNGNWNYRSKYTYVLYRKPMDKISNFILGEIQKYVEEVLKPIHSTEWTITQSWLNITKEGESHHAHTHTNSYISGVFYPKTIEDDGIVFYRGDQPELQVETDPSNPYTQRAFKYPVETGDLILFPSSTRHSVMTNDSKDDRISLAFNVMPHTLGSEEALTYLPL